ncbi:MAG: KH domain-containing protein [Lentisphaeria bacterium]|nr:KH domain-containing protein [Lentisphaeria bacterium]
MFKKLLGLIFGSSNSSSSCSCGCGSTDGSIRELKGFVEYVVKALVDYPDEVVIETAETDEGAAIKIRCRKEDIGKIVGKRGKIIMSIRSLVSGAAGRQHKRVSVDVLD